MHCVGELRAQSTRAYTLKLTITLYILAVVAAIGALTLICYLSRSTYTPPPCSVHDIWHKFQRALHDIEVAIAKDNGHTGNRLHEYTTLLPSRIPQSIDV